MSEQNILATIDGVNITDADLDAYIANLPKEQQAYATYPQFREHALKQLLAFHLYAKMAEEEKMDETDEFKAMMERARKDILAQLAINSVLKDITVTDEEMQEAISTPKDRTEWPFSPTKKTPSILKRAKPYMQSISWWIPKKKHRIS